MNCSLPGTSVGFLRQEITGVDCHLLQGIFPAQGSNPACLLHWQADSLPLNHLGSPTSLLGKNMAQDREAWLAAIHGVAKCQTRLSD